MRYTVVWTIEAERRLAKIWLESNNKASVTDAANEIDRLLRDDPWACSEGRDIGMRILTVPPLGVMFRAYPDDRLVKVISVWRFRTRSCEL
jgi:hypothetical protein